MSVEDSSNLPRVTIIIPCRNEEAHIGACLDSVLAGSYPADRFEILVADGASDDGTREIVRRTAERHPNVQLLDNTGRTAPHALNLGLDAATGEVIMRMDAHATYERNYVRKCVEYLYRWGADNVGGRWVIKPGRESLIGRAIAAVLGHPLGIGNARYRTSTGLPEWVDTVPFGCYRRDVFDRVGRFNPRLTRGQDMDFNVRLATLGGRILLVPEIVSYYHARGDLRAFARHNYVNGRWAILPAAFGSRAFSARHLVPMAFVLALAIAIGLVPVFSWARWGLGVLLGSYGAALLVAAVQLSVRSGRLGFIGVVPLALVALHLPYGVGSVVGSFEVLAHRLRGREPEFTEVYR